MKKAALSFAILFGIAFNVFAGNTLPARARNTLPAARNTLPAPKNNETRYDIIVVEGHHYLVVVTKTEQYRDKGNSWDPSVSSAISLQVLHSFGCPCMTNKVQ